MTDALRMGRRAFSIGVVGATIAWSMGLAALLQPLATHAAVAGDLIKGSLPSVYYLGANGKRYVFPNEKTFKTWFSDFSGVKTLSDADISALPIGGNATYRAGTRLVKIQTDPRVYAVEPHGTIRWIESEAVASALYGASWASRVDDVADVFFTDYTPGASVSSAAMYPAGSVVKNASSPNLYYIAGSSKQWIDPSVQSANRVWDMYVITTSQNLSAYSDGANITTVSSALTDASQTGVAGGGTPAAGGVTVALSSDTPAAATLAQGASSVPLLAFTLSAAGGDASVTGIVVHRFGVGATTDWANLYLYKTDGTRLTDGRTLATQTNDATFSGLSVAVASGTSVKLWLKGDVGTGLTSGASHGFQITAATGVTSASTVSGSFPIAGNVFTIGGANAGTVTVAVTGTITNPTLGQQQAEIGRFTVAAATEDASIQQMTFRLDGTVRGINFKNFNLKQGNMVVASAAATTTDGRYVVMNFTPAYALVNGNTRTMSLYADVGGEASRTLGIRIEYSSDVVAIGGTYGQGMQINVNGYNGGTGSDAARSQCTATGQDCSFSTVQGSTLTFAFNGPIAANLATNSKENVLLKFSVTAQQYTRIDQWGVIITCQLACTAPSADAGGLIRAVGGVATEQNLQHIKVSKQDGSGVLQGPQELVLTGSDTTQTLTFTEDIILQAGETKNLQVVADVDDEAPATDVYNAALIMGTTGTGALTAYDSNGDSVTGTAIVPSANIAGNNMTLQAASLTINLSQPPSDNVSRTTIRGTSGKDSAGFSFAAGQGSAITVTSVTLSTSVTPDVTVTNPPTNFALNTQTVAGNTVNAANIVSSVSLYDSDTGALVAGPQSVNSSTGTVLFNNFTWMIPAGTTKKLIARANIANYTVVAPDDAYAFRIAAAGDVTAQNADGATVSPTLTGGNGTASTPTVYVRVANAGTLAASLDADTPRSDIVLAGATNVSMAKVRFDATNEAFRINRVEITERGATDNGLAAGAYDNAVSAVKLSYTKQDGTPGTATGFLVSGVADFSGLSMFVAANSYATMTVSADLQTITNGATRGAKPRLNFVAATNFEAVGLSSGQTITTATSNAAGNRMVLRETRPTFALASGNPTTAGVGTGEVFRFSVSAAAGQAAVLSTITFAISSSNNALTSPGWNVCAASGTGNRLDVSDFTFYLTSDGPSLPLGSSTNWTLLNSTGAACATGTDVVGFASLTLPTPEVVAAGTTKTYSLQMNTSGASTSTHDRLQVSLATEPLVSAYIDSTRTVNGAVAAGATSITVSSSTGISARDLVCFTEDNGAGGPCSATDEVALVTAVPNGTTLTVFRGDLGRAEGGTSADGVIANSTRIFRLPASIIWDDDGNGSTVNAVSGYSLKSLPVLGSSFSY